VQPFGRCRIDRLGLQEVGKKGLRLSAKEEVQKPSSTLPDARLAFDVRFEDVNAMNLKAVYQIFFQKSFQKCSDRLQPDPDRLWNGVENFPCTERRLLPKRFEDMPFGFCNFFHFETLAKTVEKGLYPTCDVNVQQLFPSVNGIDVILKAAIINGVTICMISCYGIAWTAVAVVEIDAVCLLWSPYAKMIVHLRSFADHFSIGYSPMTHPLNRRRFFQAGAATLFSGAATPMMAESRWDQTPIVEEADVLVCGAGPAGVAAAIAAARSGAKTRLIESNGCLGGVWTAGLLSWILDSNNKSGLMREFVDRLTRRGARHQGKAVSYDTEEMKLFLEEICLEAGVDIRLHTRVVAAETAARGDRASVDLAITESKSGREAWRAKTFIDASGDGDLAAWAGCKFDYGDPDTGFAQPMSFLAMLTGIDIERATPFIRKRSEAKGLGSSKDNLLKEMHRAGVDPSYARPSLFYIRDDLFCLMANHQYRVDGTNADDLTRASIEGREEVHRLVNSLRALGGCWKDARIVSTPEYIGVREGRRIHGRYTLDKNDLIRGAQFKDGVCEVRFGIDVHSPDPTKKKGIQDQPYRSRPYQIPYRSLLARDIDGLLLAGRCISGDFIAHSSYRVTGNSVPTGEAAGVAAALSASQNVSPDSTSWEEIAAKLSTISHLSKK
jgi:FAD-dependent oxidoreductase family protein